MENFIVSARKYRPLSFDSVVGQQALTETLKNAIKSGRLAHAFLFCGPRGVGKTTCARIFAKAINCLNQNEDGEACNECESCKAFNEQRSYNIHELDAASNNGVDDIKSLIDQVRIPPQIGKYKVFIIDEVHMLSAAAFNAFLKTLEEPPAHAIFILATTEKHKILPTILSRCQIYDFNRMSVPNIVSHLEYVAKSENVKYEPEALNVIAQKADGGMRDALSIFDQVVSFTNGNIEYQKVIENLNVLDYDYYFRLTDMFLENRISDIMLTLNEVLSKGFEANHFINGLAKHLRDLLMSRDQVTLPLLEVSDATRERYGKQAAKCSVKFLYRALKMCSECDLNYRTSHNKRLLVEIALIQIAQAAQPEDSESAGRSPRKILKPIFKRIAPKEVGAGAKSAASTQATQQEEKPAVPQQTQSQPKAEEAPKQSRKPLPHITFSPSIRELMAGKTKENEARVAASITTQTSATPSATKGQNIPVNESGVARCWLEFSHKLPKEHVAIVARMQLITPVLTSDSSFSITVENEQVKEYFIKLKPSLLAYMREQLHNDSIDMEVEINEMVMSNHAKTPQQAFEEMCENNPCIRELVEKLDLALA